MEAQLVLDDSDTVDRFPDIRLLTLGEEDT